MAVKQERRDSIRAKGWTLCSDLQRELDVSDGSINCWCLSAGIIQDKFFGIRVVKNADADKLRAMARARAPRD